MNVPVSLALTLVLLAPPDQLPADEPPRQPGGTNPIPRRARPEPAATPGTLSEQSRGQLGAEEQAARQAAQRASSEGSYGAAALTLETLAKAWRPALSGFREAYVLDELEAEARAYRKREELAARATRDAAGKRALLRELLRPARSGLERASPREQRIQALIADLRRDDSATKAFFARTVKVVAADSPGVQPTHVQLVVDGLVMGLRAVGIQADTAVGDDTVTVTISSPTTNDSSREVGVAGLVSSYIRVVARWTDPGGSLVLAPIELSSNAAGFSPEKALDAAVRRSFERSSEVVLESWLASLPL